VWIDDEPEFLEACRAGIISADEQAAARAAADEIERRHRLLEEPFWNTGWQWLRRGIAVPLLRAPSWPNTRLVVRFG
jgi:hypothetical protein